MLGGKYRLVAQLGRGGMGEVWSAADQGLDRAVAIKIVLADLNTDPALLARLRREAKTGARLQHPGITVVHDIGEHDGHPFFVMELLKGTDFKTLLEGGPAGLPVERVVGLMAQVADALEYAHRQGVVHRDIKPANLMELAEGGVKICDFGISRYADAGATTALAGPDVDHDQPANPSYEQPSSNHGPQTTAEHPLGIPDKNRIRPGQMWRARRDSNLRPSD
jgi:serine/threonine protein kinase